MTPGECLCATVPEACYGSHGQLLDGGEGGSGGGGEEPDPGVRVALSGERLARYLAARGHLIDLLNNRESDCSKFLLAKLGLSGTRVARAVLGQRAFDGLLSTITMLRAGINSSRGLLADWRVSDFFSFGEPDPETNETSASAFYANPLYGADIRDVYYAPGALRAQMILHETLHYFLGITDTDLAARLGIDPGAISRDGTRVISWALRDGGCQ
jgi:hypothetical protein